MTLLMYGPPIRSPDLFQAIPLAINDPVFYAEIDDRGVAVAALLWRDQIRELGLDIEVIDPASIGNDELVAAGIDPLDIQAELCLRACVNLSIGTAVVPPDFPVQIADRLRASGVVIQVDALRFALRRRQKTPWQIEGIRRAQRAADAAMAEAAQLVRELPKGLASEDVRAAMQAVAAMHGAEIPDSAIVAHGAQTAQHNPHGSGEILLGEPVLVDIWPLDKVSRCFADMTRTFIAGGIDPPADLAAAWMHTRESLEIATAAIGPGVSCRALYELSCQPFHKAGEPTQMTKSPGTVLDRGYFHGLGHGVGLEVHERPHMRLDSNEVLLPNEVITIEPGCYHPGTGGVRLEDLVLVTDDGVEVLTRFPYDL